MLFKAILKRIQNLPYNSFNQFAADQDYFLGNKTKLNHFNLEKWFNK